MFFFTKDTTEYSTGELRDPFDPRDLTLDDIDGASDNIPTEYETDLSKFKVKDQKRNGSCVGKATSRAGEFMVSKEIGEIVDLSGRFIYGLCKIGNEDYEGTFPRNAVDILLNIGCATESFVMDNDDLPHAEYIKFPITPEILLNASQYKRPGYAFVDHNDPHKIANAIYDYGVVLITIRVGNISKSSGRIRPKDGAGTHQVVLHKYKYRNGEYTFYFMNSWGKNWGNSGYGYIKYSDYKNKEGKPEDIRSAIILTMISKKAIEDKKKQAEYFIEDASFIRAFEHVIKWEGGYANDPNDPGGETKYGISKRAYPTKDIKNLTEKDAQFLYKRDYWNQSACDRLPKGIDILVFDTAVNMGVVTAKKMLQETIGVVADGIVGPLTLGAIAKSDHKKLIKDFTTLRMEKYMSFKNFNIYGKGWTRRAIDTMAVACKNLLS